MACNCIKKVVLEDGRYIVRRIKQKPFGQAEERYVYSAWEKTTPTGTFSTITFTTLEPENRGECYGRVGTNPDRSLFAHLTGGSNERIKAVAQAYAQVYTLAYKLIDKAFPGEVNKFNNRRHINGELECW